MHRVYRLVGLTFRQDIKSGILFLFFPVQLLHADL